MSYKFFFIICDSLPNSILCNEKPIIADTIWSLTVLKAFTCGQNYSYVACYLAALLVLPKKTKIIQFNLMFFVQNTSSIFQFLYIKLGNHLVVVQFMRVLCEK